MWPPVELQGLTPAWRRSFFSYFSDRSESHVRARSDITDYFRQWGWRKPASFGMRTKSAKKFPLTGLSSTATPTLEPELLRFLLRTWQKTFRSIRPVSLEKSNVHNEGWSLSAHNLRIPQTWEYAQKKTQRQFPGQFPCLWVRKKTAACTEDSPLPQWKETNQPVLQSFPFHFSCWLPHFASFFKRMSSFSMFIKAGSSMTKPSIYKATKQNAQVKWRPPWGRTDIGIPTPASRTAIKDQPHSAPPWWLIWSSPLRTQVRHTLQASGLSFSKTFSHKRPLLYLLALWSYWVHEYLREVRGGMVIKSVMSAICLSWMRRKKPFTLVIAQSLPRLLQNRSQLQFGFHFLEDQAELMHRTQYEVDLGDLIPLESPHGC